MTTTMRQASFVLQGILPLLQHNGQLADPTNKYVKALRELTAKGAKQTDDDRAAVMLLEWEGSLYLKEGRVIVPGDMIEGVIRDGAKKLRKGPKAQAAVFCEDCFPLIYEGPKDIEALKQDQRFRDVRGVKLKSGRIMRCRPRFDSWSLKGRITFDSSIVDAKDLLTMLSKGGAECGIGDFRPRFGRFTVELFEEIKAGKNS